MKDKILNPTNIFLIAVLIILSAVKHGDLAGGLGAGLWYFTIGMAFVGVIIMALFMFIYNIFRPENKIKLGLTERMTAGLIGAILYAFIIGK